jgi:hypothetical protein
LLETFFQYLSVLFFLVIAIAEGAASPGAFPNLTGWFWGFGKRSDRLILSAGLIFG